MLMTNQLPINWYMTHKAENITCDPWCEECRCEQTRTPETIPHILFECEADKYILHRQEMIQTVIQIYQQYNSTKKDKRDEIKINYEMDDDEFIHHIN